METPNAAAGISLWLEEQLDRMRRDWDRRAAENARHYVATCRQEWSDDDFFASGEQVVADHLLTDWEDICGGRDPRGMRVLEIGCGAGRVTRALARRFGEVHAVDVSGEMVRRAVQAVAEFPNAFVYQNNGFDLSVVPGRPFDFAFSCLVFQHIPSRAVIQSYVREAGRLLRPGALFKFNLQGGRVEVERPGDTWVGVSFSEEQVKALAEDAGFEARYSIGAGEQEFWNWFFKK